MEKIAIVTDSTADLPLSYYEENNVQMVPLTVRFEEESFKDWIDINPKEFYQRMRDSDILPKTSQPSVAQFAQVYQKLAGEAEQIVSIHLSSELSGTVQAAEMAGDMANVPVTVIDTKSASLGMGLIVDAAVRAKRAGLSAEEVIKKGREATDRIKIVFLVVTLKYLHLGGRMGKAQALLGSMLNIKPILTLNEGIVTPYKKVKGLKKAYSEMKNFFLQNVTGKGALYVVFAHADCPDEVQRLREMIKSETRNAATLIESEIGSVIGTYAGPGAFAIAFYEDQADQEKGG
jgi:DegV family protein with EDD domain